MYEQEKQRSIHLTILIYNTIFLLVLIGGAIVLDWEKGPVVLLLFGIVASWLMHITGKISETSRLWLYFIFSMLAFFFYGIHEREIDNLAPIMAVFILIYISTEEHNFVRLCAITYYLTLCYDFVFVIGSPFSLPTQTMTRIFFHMVIIFVAERLAETILQRRRKEREKTEEKISRLEEANRSVEDFLANVSHELRTPINAVTGITAVMLKNEENAEKKKDILSIQMAGNRLFSQIEDILDYTEIDTGRVMVSEENYMIFSLINDLIVENRMVKWDKDLELIFDIDAGIPAVLLGDRKKIKKIIKHLVDNAVKFTKTGGVYIRVYALRKAYGINLCIRVSDTGIGIAEDEMEKITGRFFQANGGRNRKAGGLGLGLPIVYGMVSAMDGFIRLESAEESGTTVSVSIPQKVVDAAPSMVVQNRNDLCVAIYLKPEKYKVPAIRDYYNATITHLVQGLDLMVHRVLDSEELKKLVDMYQLTHLIIGREEYEEDAAYYEELGKSIDVVLVTDDDFLPADSRVNLMKKPFYCLPMVNILNSKAFVDVDEFKKEKNMICPGVRVLVVDDEPMNLMVAEGIFHDYQMQVKTAEGGMKAIEIFQKEEFDLIFLDHMMPEMDGVETLKRIRKIQADMGKTCPIIAFTANAVSGAREMFIQEGFDEFISKPVEDHELKRLLEKVLPKKSITYVAKDDTEKPIAKEQEQTVAEQSAGQEPTREADLEKDKLTQLNEKGFHTKNGLQYCRGNQEFYEEVLIKFAMDAEHKIEDIEASFQKEDMRDYQVMVHALKSSSKMIGADMLSVMAKDAEDAAKDQNVSYIKENHAGLIDKYRETVQIILDVMPPAEEALPGEDPSKEEPAVLTEVFKDELLGQLQELKESLDTFEADKAETLLEEMS
ncbi:MAG: response regulator, partial [Lachnospiraceae bacterium]|nr:response regulator [Lachnospiraceae bacterium]